MSSRLGVDVGGTFTDLVYYDQATQETVVAKAPTTPFRERAWIDFAVWRREELPVGTHFAGPAILLEQTATSYLDAGLNARVHESGCVIVTRQEGRP